MSGDPSASWGARLRAGDDAALEEIQAAWRQALAASLLRKHAGRLQAHDVEVVLNEALLRLWNARGQYDPGRASVRTYFSKIVHNVACDMLKSGQIGFPTQHTLQEPESLDAPAADGPDPLTSNGEERSVPPLAAWLRATIARFPRLEREIVLEDLAHPSLRACDKELAARLGIARSSVRKYRCRAHARLLVEWAIRARE